MKSLLSWRDGGEFNCDGALEVNERGKRVPRCETGLGGTANWSVRANNRLIIYLATAIIANCWKCSSLWKHDQLESVALRTMLPNETRCSRLGNAMNIKYRYDANCVRKLIRLSHPALTAKVHKKSFSLNLSPLRDRCRANEFMEESIRFCKFVARL